MAQSDREDQLPRGSWEATPDATEAFELLGNETRLNILLALWEELDPLDPAGVSFSTLRERVGMRDSGQFNYHLGKLAGQFVRQTETGYQFMPVGLELVQTVIAGTGTDVSMSPQELDLPCVRCGGTTAMTYQNGWLYYVCLECETSPLASDAPPGALFGEPFSPAAFRAREPSELFAAAFFKLLEVTTMKAGGLCPRCDGPIESQLSVCGDHEVADETCPNCGQIRPAVIRWLCPICKFVGSGSPGGISMTRPELITFYTEHGVDLANPGSSVETAKRIWQLINAHTQEVVSTDPARVRVTASYDDASITLLYDEDVDVIAVE